MTAPRWLTVARELFRKEPWWAELWSGVAALALAVWALTPPHGSMLVLPELRSPVNAAELAMWQATGAALGSVQVVVLLWNSRIARWCVCVLASWWWSFLTAAIYTWEPGALLLPLLAVQAGVNLFGVVRLLRDYA